MKKFYLKGILFICIFINNKNCNKLLKFFNNLKKFNKKEYLRAYTPEEYENLYSKLESGLNTYYSNVSLKNKKIINIIKKILKHKSS